MSDRSTSTLYRATIFHTPAKALAAFEDGGLLVRDGRVAACGDFASVRALDNGAELRDLRGSVIVPGFVDAHVHFPQLRIIGALGRTLLDWLEEVALPEEARMADVSYAQGVAAEFVRALASHGTTTALVFGAHFSGATAALFDAAAAAGLRITSGLVVSDRRLRPDLHHTPAAAYRESVELIRRYHGKGRLQYAVTPRFALSASEAMLEVCGTLMNEHSDVRLQTHINENASEISELARLFPWAGDYLAVYEKFSLSSRRSVMAHNIHATESEIDRLAAAGTSIAHCPCSNQMLGSGMFPLRRHRTAGVTCALGTDVGGGVGFGLMKEALHAYLIQRMMPNGVPLVAGELLYLSTLAGAEALGLAADVGDFTPGKAADCVILRPEAGSVLEAVLHRAESTDEVLGALFALAGAADVREVFVEGACVYAS